MTDFKIPSKATLKKYGITQVEWKNIWILQGQMCPICGRTDAPLVIDHEHVRGWKKMKPEQRKKYIRGIICSWDNRWIVRKGATAKRLYYGSLYLQEYDERRPA